jgi:cytochrome c peroxidase
MDDSLITFYEYPSQLQTNLVSRMNKLLFTFALLAVMVAYGVLSCTSAKPDPQKEIARTLVAQVDSFIAICNRFQKILENNSGSSSTLQTLFLQTRIAYKKFEWAAEYFEPATTRFVNGPPVQEVELSGQVFEPAGLQVIEGYLFPAYDTASKIRLLKQLSMLSQAAEKYKTYFNNFEIFEGQVFDAARLEVFRVMTLGITGFDNPLTLKNMQESSTALRSLREIFTHYPDNGDTIKLENKFNAAIGFLDTHTEFNSFNRMDFLTDYCNPVTIGIADLEKKLNVHVYKYNRLLNQDAKILFDTNTFNVNAYAPDFSSFVTERKIALGKALFSDPLLSGNGKRSCQSCHQPDKAFTDGWVKNTVIDKEDLLGRNTPTLINAALQPSLFYDLRVNTLEDQSHTVVQNEAEMHGSMVLSVKKLWDDKKYRAMFLAAFPGENKNGIDTFEIMNALGSYVRSLTYLNSRFDEYMRGNKTSMGAGEINGFNLFMGKAKCGTCHYMPLFNGTLPPRYVKIESEVIGVPESLSGETIDPDLGRYNIVKVESFRHAFKIPTVRNAGRTAPYMHNGVFNTLSQVVDFYNKGGGTGLGMKMGNQTLPFDKLSLTDSEQKDIVAFINSLDSKRLPY